MNSKAALVDHLFRTEYGKVFAILCKFLGLSKLQLAEDIVQDALISALTDCAINGVPDHSSPTMFWKLWLKGQIKSTKRKNKNTKHQLTVPHYLLSGKGNPEGVSGCP